MKPTVREIAKKAGVSVASVSMVLNDKPSRITEPTKQKIKQAAAELGYNFEKKQKQLEAAAANHVNHIIGVIRPGCCQEYMDAYLKGISRYAHIRGYQVVNAAIEDSTRQALEYVRLFRDIQAAGIIMIPPKDMNEGSNNKKLGQGLTAAGRPFLLLDQAIDRVFCDFITADNKDAAYLATEYLIHKGHRKIGIITGRREAYTSRKYVEGYKEALAFYNLSIANKYVYYGDNGEKAGYEGMEYLDKMDLRAVFVCDDNMAMGVYRYAREQGLSIGDKLSVIGRNASRAAAVLNPPLTSINQPGELMGRKACEVLIRRMTGEDQEAVKTMYFAPALVEGASVQEEPSS